jgi:hypothetical protein
LASPLPNPRFALKTVLLLAVSPIFAMSLGAQSPDAVRSAPSTSADSGIEAASGGIRASDFARRISVLAHDSMRGRVTPSPELDAAASWIASEFQRFGLRPAGDAGGFLQRYVVPSSPGRSAPNVVGILEGSDPVLRDEYVVISAHIDHLGVGPRDARGDSVYNGADDNASGTTAVIEIAEAMAALQPRPKRSFLFALVSGEEEGLWGSGYLMDHAPVPVERMVADLNVDMVGRNWKDTIVVIGREHSNLGEYLARARATDAQLNLVPIDDPWPAERFFFRSDHYNFARRGVPSLFFFNGVHSDYHRPSDHWEKIDTEKAARVARLVFRMALELGNHQERPRWNPESYRRIVGAPPEN